jgi:hypothetical protein
VVQPSVTREELQAKTVAELRAMAREAARHSFLPEAARAAALRAIDAAA